MSNTLQRGRTMRQDWLPWSLSIFGAGCAVFVLVQGVLPARSANEQLSQKVVRLEAELARATESAKNERSSMEQVHARLSQQVASGEEQLKAVQALERAKGSIEIAKRDLSLSLSRQIKAGDVRLVEKNGELVVEAAHALLFGTGSTAIKPGGRIFLRNLAQSIGRLSDDQVYQVRGQTAEHQRATLRFLELQGKVPSTQLAAAEAPLSTPGAEGQKNPSLEITLSRGKR